MKNKPYTPKLHITTLLIILLFCVSLVPGHYMSLSGLVYYLVPAVITGVYASVLLYKTLQKKPISKFSTLFLIIAELFLALIVLYIVGGLIADKLGVYCSGLFGEPAGCAIGSLSLVIILSQSALVIGAVSLIGMATELIQPKSAKATKRTR